MKRKIPKGTIAWQARIAAGLMVGVAGCSGTYESATKQDLATAATIVAEEDDGSLAAEPLLDGSLNSYVAFALARSPELRASFERWRAATMRISRARRIPEPVIKYSYFVRSGLVEVVHDDPAALSNKALSERSANPLTRSSDEDNLVVQ